MMLKEEAPLVNWSIRRSSFVVQLLEVVNATKATIYLERLSTNIPHNK